MGATLRIKLETNGPNPHYQKGDIVTAYSQLRTEMNHAKIICHRMKYGFNSDGLRDPAAISNFAYQTTHKYLMQRVSPGEALRTNLLTGDELLLSRTPRIDPERPNAKPIAIDPHWAVFYKTHKYNKPLKKWEDFPRHLVYGNKGSEFWYEKELDESASICTKLFDEIEAKGKGLRTNYQNWPYDNNELSIFLVLPVDDFDNQTTVELCRSIYVDPEADKKVTLKRRECFCDYESLSMPSGITIDDIKDRSKLIDIRTSSNYLRTNIVGVKAS